MFCRPLIVTLAAVAALLGPGFAQATDGQGNPWFFIALESGSAAAVEWFLRHGASPTAPDRGGRLPPEQPSVQRGTLTGEKAAEFHLSLGPFRQVVKDYFQICESYFDAVKRLPPSQIEAIDMARRGIHNEGARVLAERLEGKAEVDTATARRLFTLICVMHWG